MGDGFKVAQRVLTGIQQSTLEKSGPAKAAGEKAPTANAVSAGPSSRVVDAFESGVKATGAMLTKLGATGANALDHRVDAQLKRMGFSDEMIRDLSAGDRSKMRQEMANEDRIGAASDAKVDARVTRMGYSEEMLQKLSPEQRGQLGKELERESSAAPAKDGALSISAQLARMIK